MIKSQSFIEYYESCPMLIRLTWDTIALLSVLLVLTLIFLKVFRSNLRIQEKIAGKYQTQYEHQLISYLFAESEGESNSEQTEIINNFKEIVESPFKREIVINTLLKLKNEITGELAESIDRFYIQTGLFKYAFNNVRSNNWYLNAKGIRELKQFNAKKAHKAILERNNHPKIEVRKEVQLYLVNLFEFK